MCGIAGFISKNEYPPEIIEKMLTGLFHRGPDSCGFYKSGSYQAGMRRLSINDLTTGDQPLYNEDKTIVLVYNGEIYNYPKLRKELENKGHKFLTRSDGEVICHLYEDVGEKLFTKLDGMFAIALWDDKKKRLILSRDLPGEKPLYYSLLSENGIAFASEIKSLIKFPEINKSLDHQSIWDFPTFLWIPEPNTIYENIKALMPGHILIADRTGIKQSKYENLFESNLKLDFGNEKEVIKEVRRIVEESIISRLLSDVPVGSFLSGGLDSSIIATIAKKHLHQLDTFTIGFDDLDDPYHGKADESVDAANYAKILGTNHHSIHVTGADFLDLLDKFFYYGDQPWAVSSGLGMLAISAAARQAGIKVLLTGDGADENFGGYSWYFHLTNNSGNSINPDKNISFQNFGLPLEDRLKNINSFSAQEQAWAWHYYASESEKQSIFNQEMFNGSQNSLRWFEQFNNSNNWQAKKFISHDKIFYFPNEMLKKADRMTMANSVEGRSPFAAPAILNLSGKLPYEILVKNGQLKWVLRQAFADILPPEIINRPKHGFNIPIDHWLNNEWSFLVDETFSSSSFLAKQGLINKDSLNIAKTMLADKQRLNGHTIFCYVMMNKWLEKFT